MGEVDKKLVKSGINISAKVVGAHSLHLRQSQKPRKIPTFTMKIIVFVGVFFVQLC